MMDMLAHSQGRNNRVRTGKNNILPYSVVGYAERNLVKDAIDKKAVDSSLLVIDPHYEFTNKR
jgi:hypothetical protein